MTQIITKMSGDRLWKQVADAVQKGKLVVFPTETVYGLGANAYMPDAVKEIFRVKGRPQDNPLIVHGASLKNLLPLVNCFPDYAYELAERFWPGPLTLVLPASQKANKIVTGGLSTIAIRVPSHPLAMRLLSESETAIAAPSANLSGKPSPTRVEHVLHDLEGKVDFIIDGGPCQIGLESTVLDISGDFPVVLRPGAITMEELTKVCGMVKTAGEKSDDRPRSPGMKYKHYAPEAEVIVIGPQEGVERAISEKIKDLKSAGKTVGVLSYDGFPYEADFVKSLGSREDLATAARRLFALLRDMDNEGVDVIIAEGVKPEGIGLAIMNRLYKAAGKGDG